MEKIKAPEGKGHHRATRLEQNVAKRETRLLDVFRGHPELFCTRNSPQPPKNEVRVIGYRFGSEITLIGYNTCNAHTRNTNNTNNTCNTNHTYNTYNTCNTYNTNDTEYRLGGSQA